MSKVLIFSPEPVLSPVVHAFCSEGLEVEQIPHHASTEEELVEMLTRKTETIAAVIINTSPLPNEQEFLNKFRGLFHWDIRDECMRGGVPRSWKLALRVAIAKEEVGGRYIPTHYFFDNPGIHIAQVLLLDFGVDWIWSHPETVGGVEPFSAARFKMVNDKLVELAEKDRQGQKRSST